MEKEKLTLQEKFYKYQGREFCTRQHKTIDKNSSFARFTIVGYVDLNNNYLIGLNVTLLED